MDQWLCDGLSNLLDFEVPEDLIKYVSSIQKESDLNEYMATLLDFDNAQHRKFFEELVKKKFPSSGAPVKKQKKKILKDKAQGGILDEHVLPSDNASESKSKKKTKFVNLYSKEGQDAQVILLKGRHKCNCEASKHKLINNCLECGRIVCEQEGSGPCLFCGSLVCTEEEELKIMTETKSGSKLKESLMSQKEEPVGYQKALALRDRLLECDKNSKEQTRVVDDDCDYFSAGSVWLGAKERAQLDTYQQELHDKKHSSRLDKTMTFDFAGRQIVVDESTEQANLARIHDIVTTGGPTVALGGPEERMVAPGVDPSMIRFDESVVRKTIIHSGEPGSVFSGRLQDTGPQSLVDAGLCLSMHQPWASLLVDGIKLHEGRTWYSTHRGPLWIASAAAPPDPVVVASLEQEYRLRYPDKELNFPKFYPTGCLLGCVIVEDCLPYEEYKEIYPDGESDSPYVFICSNPQSLRLRFPVKGQHKIYSLDKTIHAAAVTSLRTMKRVQAGASSG